MPSLSTPTVRLPIATPMCTPHHLALPTWLPNLASQLGSPTWLLGSPTWLTNLQLSSPS